MNDHFAARIADALESIAKSLKQSNEHMENLIESLPGSPPSVDLEEIEARLMGIQEAIGAAAKPKTWEPGQDDPFGLEPK